VKNPLALVFRTCATAALAFVISANASAGVVFRGTIDPEFGLGFTGLNYSGEAFFDVDADCLAISGVHAPTEACGSISLLSATVTLSQGATTQLLTFFPDPPTPDPITAYWISGNTLASVDTSPFGPQFASLGYTGPLWLEFFTEFVSDQPVARADLITGTCPFEGECVMAGPEGHTEVATVTITQVVPEPTTVALLLAAMTAGWIVRRKRAVRH